MNVGVIEALAALDAAKREDGRVTPWVWVRRLSGAAARQERTELVYAMKVMGWLVDFEIKGSALISETGRALMSGRDERVVAKLRLPAPAAELASLVEVLEAMYGPGLRSDFQGPWMRISTPGPVASA